MCVYCKSLQQFLRIIHPRWIISFHYLRTGASTTGIHSWIQTGSSISITPPQAETTRVLHPREVKHLIVAGWLAFIRLTGRLPNAWQVAGGYLRDDQSTKPVPATYDDLARPRILSDTRQLWGHQVNSALEFHEVMATSNSLCNGGFKLHYGKKWWNSRRHTWLYWTRLTGC